MLPCSHVSLPCTSQRGVKRKPVRGLAPTGTSMAGPPVARTAQAPPSATRSANDSRPSAAEPRSLAFTASSTRQPRCEQPQAYSGFGVYLDPVKHSCI